MPRRSTKIYIITDGASRGNPGPSAIGYGIYDSDWNVIEEKAEYIGSATNNEAEYKAVVKALDCAAGHCRGEIEHFTDSKLVVNQLSGNWKVKADNLKPLIEDTFNKKRYFKSIAHMHLPRTHQRIRRIDDLANQKLDESGFTQ
jgi:ribonuclease HI